MSTRIRSNIGMFTHDNYNITGTPATKTLPSNTSNMLVENMDTSVSIYVSFDAGSTWKTIKAGSAIELDCDNFKSYAVKSASGTVAVECLYGSEI